MRCGLCTEYMFVLELEMYEIVENCSGSSLIKRTTFVISIEDLSFFSPGMGWPIK